MYLTFNFKQTLVNTLYRFSHLSLLINQWRVASTSVFLEYINMRDWGTRLDGRWERKAILCNGVKVWQGHQFKKQLMPLMSYMIYSPVCKENIGSGHELSGRCARKGPRKATTSPPLILLALTVTALFPVVSRQAVVTFGPRCAVFTLTEARAVTPVVDGAQLVAVALWWKAQKI